MDDDAVLRILEDLKPLREHLRKAVTAPGSQTVLVAALGYIQHLEVENKQLKDLMGLVDQVKTQLPEDLMGPPTEQERLAALEELTHL